MKNLKIILAYLENCYGNIENPYFIPEIWNAIGYSEYSVDHNHQGQIGVNPYAFMTACIKEGILAEVTDGVNYLQSLAQGNRETEKLSQSVIYGTSLRTFTAWDHYGDGKIYSGTFLKAICLLPYLKKLNINIIYLLPVFKCSNKYKKGELGSPYAIQDIYGIDPDLHDPLLGQYDDKNLEIEFKAFMEACHILGIKVIIDFVFRTVSRDNVLLVEHPEWFYWIHCKNNSDFAPPAVESEKKLTVLNDNSLKSLYTCAGITEYLSYFTYAPPELDAEKWQQVVKKFYGTDANILDLIEDTFRITTAPGFSDVLNDPQPAWTDVTYLRFYQDVNSKVKPYLPEGQPPYILQDVASLNCYPGDYPNRELMEYILNVIPYYQDQYGIDGARIDMAHALPPELNQEIVSRVKAKDKQFILWSEEFAAENSQKAKDDGFHFISGDLCSIYYEVFETNFYQRLLGTIASAAIPMLGALETPDTPRMAHIYRDRSRITMMVLLNYLMPNTVPFITGGMELLEIQPMNLGINNDESGRFVLDRMDPMYGKLAFFDRYCLHWLNQEQEWMRQLLIKALSIRKDFSDLIEDYTSFMGEPLSLRNSKILFFGYYNPQTRRNLFFLANKNLQQRTMVQWDGLFPEAMWGKRQSFRWVFIENQLENLEWEGNQKISLNPGEVRVGFLD